ncbi:MAG: cation diffusion facilitator family transporter [Nitrospirota bacterium]
MIEIFEDIKNTEYYHLHDHNCEFDLEFHNEDDKEHDNCRRLEKNKLLLASAVTGLIMIVEAGGGLFSNSLALVSDAGHMLTHLLALLISLFALIFSFNPPTERRTFGFYRLEILAALFNGVTLILITGWIFYESYKSFLSPRHIYSSSMFTIAIIGLIANLLTTYILSGSHSINIKSAFIHMIGDTLSSVAVVIGAVIINLTDWVIIDPILSILICIAILIWSYRLIMESIDILLEATPKNISIKEVIEAIRVVDNDVKNVHDVHVWTLTSQLYALSAHVSINNISIKDSSNLLRDINRILRQRFKIGHVAIQFEYYHFLSTCNKNS